MKKTQFISSSTSAEELAKLVTTKDYKICQQVAQHPNTSPDTLKELFKKFPAEVLNNPVLNLLTFRKSQVI